ncbi:MAG: D-glycero-beta-D-manno-heptose 1-phosphate adenylyltransferase [Bacteroidia bacterium]|nr:D-glycero-beta-D-manno-heptose 1-phosphate adenylyltransferase [Bacteroidia bacterium]MCF8426281.1 D-glycero-beta-D-manno-heptose 1-phosphate adenylyltransferase [Bacteroidia bacterium]MCF8445486.1 D-glycero-beta-D-manno-heptose 1-phosphate adenylyltransferase [Bacteroidia bacterium]
MSKHNLVQTKILTPPSLQLQLAKWAEEKKTVVFTNGCFDILHRGHVDYLAKAADLGDVLIIGVNTDASVSRLKGPHRPIQDEQSRLQILASLGFVDGVILFDEPTPLNLIQLVQPDVLVKGSDYQPADIVGYEIVMAKGGDVKTIDFIPGFSTSAIEKKIKQS